MGETRYREAKLDSTDLYEVLGVYQDATKDEIRCAFRKLQKLVHPDKENNTQIDRIMAQEGPTCNEEYFKDREAREMSTKRLNEVRIIIIDKILCSDSSFPMKKKKQ